MTDSGTNLLGALKDHPVVRVATVYAIGGWLLIQFADIVLEAFEAPASTMRTLLMAVLVGFPLATAVTGLVQRASTRGARGTPIALSVIVAAAGLSSAAYVVTVDDRLEAPVAVDAPVDPMPLPSRGAAPVLAVLPLDNMSGVAENEYLADGLTEDIITMLAQSPGLDVIARNSTFRYKGQSPDIREVGRELGADYVVEGSLRPMGDRFRVTVQLIESGSGAHVWAENYDQPAGAFLSLQDDVSLGIAAALGDVILRTEIERVRRSRTEDLDAWELTSRADTAFFQTPLEALGPSDFDISRAAVDADPGYGLAHAVLARQLSYYALFSLGTEDSAEERREAEAEARRALRLAPDDPKVLAYSATALLWVGLPEQALPLAEKAVRLSPSYAQGLLYYGDILIHNGRAEEALPILRKAIMLTPDAPELAIYLACLGEAEVHVGDFAAAETTFEGAARRSGSSSGFVLHNLAGVQLQLGKREAALATLLRLRELLPDRTVAVARGESEFYSADRGGARFQAMWRDLEALEAELPPRV